VDTGAAEIGATAGAATLLDAQTAVRNTKAKRQRTALEKDCDLTAVTTRHSTAAARSSWGKRSCGGAFAVVPTSAIERQLETAASGSTRRSIRHWSTPR
jgi:hypothetical protein